MHFDGFNWDDGNRDKCTNHGVSLSEIEVLFKTIPRIGPDPAHSSIEKRFRAVGRNAEGRHLFVVFTVRPDGVQTLIRPISARYMHQKEIEAYESAFSRLQE